MSAQEMKSTRRPTKVQTVRRQPLGLGRPQISTPKLAQGVLRSRDRRGRLTQVSEDNGIGTEMKSHAYHALNAIDLA